MRGEATGLQSSAASAGFALGSPVVGMAIDVSTPTGGFAAAGLAGLLAALTGYLLSRRSPAAVPSPITWVDRPCPSIRRCIND